MAMLTDEQLLGIEVSTRFSSVASILGSLFVVCTFLFLPYFRKSTARLILYATWGNMATNVATLVSTSAIPKDPARVIPLCEAQAFLIQWFMLADPFWVFCVALNVWRIFISRCDDQELRRLEKWYILFAYGIPAVTSITYLIHDHVSEQHIMGPAILWCWVSKGFDWMRIAFFYAPVWVLTGTTMGIHIYVGLYVHTQLAPLRNFRKEPQRSPTPPSSDILEDPFYDPKHEIVVTTKIGHNLREDDLISRSVTPEAQNWLTPLPSTQKPATPHPTEASDMIQSSTPCSPTTPSRYGLLVPLNPNSPHRHKQPLLIGRYRATAYAAPLASGDFATLPSPRVPVFHPSEHAAHIRRREENAAAFAYFKVALLLSLALIVVWVPPSINRLYQIVHPNLPNYGLNLASALVLPTQGFWNAIVYATTTWPECKRAYAMIVSKLTGKALSCQLSDDAIRVGTIKYNGSISVESEVAETSLCKSGPSSSAQIV